MDFKLIIKKLEGRLSEEESLIFNKWYDSSKKHKEYFLRVQKNYYKESDFIDVERAWNELESKLQRQKKQRSYFTSISIAASIAILVTLSIVFSTNSYRNNNVISSNTSSVSPGTDKAVLTLADGKNVILEKGKAYTNATAESNGEQIVYKKSESNKSAAFNHLTVPRGGQFYITLSDGTQVWMNSETKLKYPEHFVEGKTRKVELVYGEAYFDVTHSSKLKGSDFIVATKNQNVRVLGTEFNIKAYNEQNAVYTTLVSGKVMVKNTSFTEKLAPGQQSRVSIADNTTIKVTNVNVAEEVSWRRGVFNFKGKTLQEITQVLSRWYDIDFVFENESLKNQKFIGSFNRKKPLQEVLQAIESIDIIQGYEIKKDVIVLK